jgi:predicted RNA-binding Zn-ribbon protein involved in translation (DUF1610 family)
MRTPDWRSRRRRLTYRLGTPSAFLDTCPRCGYLNALYLLEAIHPPMHTQAEYDCASCGKRNVTVIRCVQFGAGGSYAATSRWEWIPVTPATVHDPDRLGRRLTACGNADVP